MLPRSSRLPSVEVRQVLRHGKRFTDGLLQLTYESNKHSSSRFAFVVGVKIDKRATVRNRVRRLLRESVHHLLPSVVGSWDIVIIGRKPLVGQNQKDVEAEIRSIFLRMKFIA